MQRWRGSQRLASGYYRLAIIWLFISGQRFECGCIMNDNRALGERHQLSPAQFAKTAVDMNVLSPSASDRTCWLSGRSNPAEKRAEIWTSGNDGPLVAACDRRGGREDVISFRSRPQARVKLSSFRPCFEPCKPDNVRCVAGLLRQFGDAASDRRRTSTVEMSLGTILLIIVVIALLGGFTGLGGGPFYGTGYYGGGGLGLSGSHSKRPLVLAQKMHACEQWIIVGSKCRFSSSGTSQLTTTGNLWLSVSIE